MGFPEFFEKIVGSIHFVPGINPYGVSLLTPIHCRVPSLIFDPLVAKYLAENGVSGTFWKNYWLNSFHNLAFTLMGWVSWPLYIFVFLASCSVLWWPNIWPKMGFPELFSCDQAAIWLVQSVCPSVCLSVRHTFLIMFPSSYHHEIFRSCCQWQVTSIQKVKVRGQRSRSQRSTPNLAFSGL